MRINLFPIALLAVLASCHGPNGRWVNRNKWVITDEEWRPLNGNPRQITEYTGKLSSDTLSPEERKSYFLRYGFDDGGTIEDLMFTGKDTDSYQKNTYRYDPQGNWVRRISTEQKKPRFPDYLTSQPNVTDREIVY